MRRLRIISIDREGGRRVEKSLLQRNHVLSVDARKTGERERGMEKRWTGQIQREENEKSR